MSEADRAPRLSSKIYVAGHRGLVGSAIVRRLASSGYERIVTATREQLDLLDLHAVREFLSIHRPDYVFVAAAKVGGIQANNTRRAQFIYENLTIAANVIHSAHLADVPGLMMLGSSCIYPRDCSQPIREDFLLTGPLEKTNEPYAIAKIAALKMAEAYHHQYGRGYVSVMPTNLYGPGDNYDLESSHVLPALLRKAHEAKLCGRSDIEVWGSGAPRREFLHVDDLADACVFLMEAGYVGPLVNIGTGSDISIAELARLVMDTVGFNGGIRFDLSRPDGTPRKVLNVSRMRELGWESQISIEAGLPDVYRAFLREQAHGLGASDEELTGVMQG